jgi:hypothetical protein
LVPTSKFEVRSKKKRGASLLDIDRTYCVTADKAHKGEVVGRLVSGAGWCYENTARLSVRVGKEVQTWEGKGG